MLDVKAWLETTGLTVAESRFLYPPTLPYVVFLVAADIGGADLVNTLISRDITIELYAETVSAAGETGIEALLDALPTAYTKTRIWLAAEKMFETIYEFTIAERK